MASYMSESSDTASSTPSSQDIFPLLKLPRELRDWIYDDALDDHQMVLSDGVKLEATNVANATLLTVGQQFGQEYGERSVKKAELELSDRPEFCYTTFEVPPAVATIRSLRINLVASTRYLTSHASKSHIAWVEKVLEQTTALRRLSIKINNNFEGSESDYSGMRDALNNGFWVNIPQLAALQVYDVSLRPGAGYKGNFDFTHSDRMVMEWSAETRKVELTLLGLEKKAPEV